MTAHRLAAAVLAGAAALLAGDRPARADLVRLIDGKFVEGKSTFASNKYTVKGYKGKSTTYAASEVKYCEKGECSWDVAARMAKDIPADASDALFIQKHLEVARYLKERLQYTPEMVDIEAKEYESVLKKDAANEEAHAGLGHVKWGTWWFKGEKERDAFRKGALANQMEPLGYVKYKKTGMWELKEDAEAMDAGKVKYKGKWMTEDEKKLAQGYIKDEKGGWVLERDQKDKDRALEVEKTLGEKPVTVMSSPNFRFISWLSPGETAKLKDLAEKAFAWIRETYGFPAGTEENPGEPLFGDPIDVFVLVDGKRKDKWLDTFGVAYGYTPANLDFYKRGDGGAWHRLLPTPYLITSGRAAEKNRQRDTEQDYNTAALGVCSMVGRIVLDRIRSGRFPAWLGEATGFLTEIRFHETADFCYVTETKYREETASKEGSKAKYYEFMKAQVAAGLDRSMREIFTLDLNYLDWADTVKAWSFLDFLREKDPAEVKELMHHPFPEVEQILPEQVEAAVKARKPKDPAAAPVGKKDEGPIRDKPIVVSGAGAEAVTEDSKEERALHGAQSEAWLQEVLKKDIVTLEKEWKEWLKGK